MSLQGPLVSQPQGTQTCCVSLPCLPCAETSSASPCSLCLPCTESPYSTPPAACACLADRLIGLPEGRARNHNRPQQVPLLAGVFIEDIAVGAEHTLALSSTGDVYAWGSNSEGQVCPPLFLPFGEERALFFLPSG